MGREAEGEGEGEGERERERDRAGCGSQYVCYSGRNFDVKQEIF